MQSKHSKFYQIDTKVKSISNKLSIVESRVAALKSKFHESEKRISDVELSRSFQSNKSDEIKTNIDVLSQNIASLRNESIDLNETIIDLQARSMRGQFVIL